MTFHPVELSDVDRKIVATRRGYVEAIARVFGLPPWILTDAPRPANWRVIVKREVGRLRYRRAYRRHGKRR